MEGVVVSAKRDGSTISISVVTDAEGRFAFPAARLEPGHYALKARAAGYEIDAARAADVAAGGVASADIRLRSEESSAHLTNGEWMSSMPGTTSRSGSSSTANGCHTLERIMKSTYDADGFMQIFQRMAGYYPAARRSSRSGSPAPRRATSSAAAAAGRPRNGSRPVNLSQQQTWAFPLKTEPRLKGQIHARHHHEYDLPNPLIQPHDVVLDREGNAWYSDFGQMFPGKLDPKTGKVTQYPIPVVKPGWSEGTLDLEIDRDDNPWVGVMYQSAIAKSTGRPRSSACGRPQGMGHGCGPARPYRDRGAHSDNKVWIKTPTAAISTASTSSRTKWRTWAHSRIRKPASASAPTASTRTRATTPTCSTSRPATSSGSMRRPGCDRIPDPDSDSGRGADASITRRGCGSPNTSGNAIGMFDPKTERITEWKVPTPWRRAYDAVAGKNGEAWTGRC